MKDSVDKTRVSFKAQDKNKSATFSIDSSLALKQSYDALDESGGMKIEFYLRAYHPSRSV